MQAVKFLFLLTRPCLITEGYIEAFQVPPSARNVIIEEVSPSNNFIGIGSSTKAVFYLNGRR